MNFYQSNKIGKAWEKKLVTWMKGYLGDKWEIYDTSHVYRDKDGDQFPDFTLVNTETRYASFIDAKKRILYRHRGYKPSFGFDKKYYTSYKNIARKHETKCYVGFYDPQYDSQHFYLLDLEQPEDFIFDYGNNGYGEPICYRWFVDSLLKFKL